MNTTYHATPRTVEPWVLVQSGDGTKIAEIYVLESNKRLAAETALFISDAINGTQAWKQRAEQAAEANRTISRQNSHMRALLGRVLTEVARLEVTPQPLVDLCGEINEVFFSKAEYDG